MAAGDVKGEIIAIEVQSGAAVVKGDCVHLESDGYWDPTDVDDLGSYGIALTACDESANFMCCVWGQVEVDCSGNIPKGALGVASGLGQIRVQTYASGADASNNLVVGKFTEAGTGSSTATLFIGLVH